MGTPSENTSSSDKSPEIPSSGDAETASNDSTASITDPEFGPLQAADGGCQLELTLDGPPNGPQKITVFLNDVQAIDPAQRGILQEITTHWPAIWDAARQAWFQEFPKDRQTLTGPHEWVLEAEIANEQTIQEEFEGDRIWRLALSGNGGSDMLILMLEGDEVLDTELL